MPKLKTQQVGQAGEHFVAAELHRRGAYAVTFSGCCALSDGGLRFVMDDGTSVTIALAP